MVDKEKGCPAESSPFNESQPNFNKKPLGKLDRMLCLFAEGRSFNTFEAQRQGDTCLHTTISGLQFRHAIQFSRKWETVQNRFGSETRVRRYWLEGEQRERARQIAGIQ